MAIETQNWLDAQCGVLGSALISPEIIPDVLSQTEEKDFFGASLAIYRAIRTLFLAGQPVDVITIADKLGGEYRSTLMQLMEITPTAANYKHYIALCKKQSRIYRLREVGEKMAMETDADKLQELLEEAVSINSAKSGIRVVSIHQAFLDFINRHAEETPPDFLSWPIRELNDQLFIEQGDFVILAGKPSAGKTAFALQCAWELSKSKRVGFFSLETGEKKLTDRHVSAVSGVPLENIKRNAMNQSHWDSIVVLDPVFKGRSLDIITQSGLRVADIQALAAAKKYDVIFIDYIHLLAELKDTRVNEIGNISLSLHRFSQDAQCCVVGLSQLSRPSEGKGKIPDMHSLKDSSQLEQDADAVLILYLDNEENPQSQRILRCAKNKEGERFSMRLDFDGRRQTFSKAKSRDNYDKDMARIARENKLRERDNNFPRLPDSTPVPYDTVGGIL